MGFDILYLPPIHPIGHTHRKGRNNALVAAPDDVGSPWAIGSEAGGQRLVEPALGTLEDFDQFVAAARNLGLEAALDLAYQCSPDHPWVREHAEQRPGTGPDGTIWPRREPPKSLPGHLPDRLRVRLEWRSLWHELEAGGRVLRAGYPHLPRDNPHTKAFHFWEWMTAEALASTGQDLPRPKPHAWK